MILREPCYPGADYPQTAVTGMLSGYFPLPGQPPRSSRPHENDTDIPPLVPADALHGLAARGGAYRAQGGPRRGLDRRRRGPAPGGGLRHHCRHAPGVRPLCGHGARHCRRLLRFVAPLGIRARDSGVGGALFRPLYPGDARYARLCHACAHAHLHGRRAGARPGSCPHGGPCQLHLPLGGRGLYRRGGAPDRRHAARALLRGDHGQRRSLSRYLDRVRRPCRRDQPEHRRRPFYFRLVPVDNSLIFINFMNRLRAKRTDSLTNRFFLLSIRPV